MTEKTSVSSRLGWSAKSRAQKLDAAEKKALGLGKKAAVKPKPKAKKKSVRKSVSDSFWNS